MECKSYLEKDWIFMIQVKPKQIDIDSEINGNHISRVTDSIFIVKMHNCTCTICVHVESAGRTQSMYVHGLAMTLRWSFPFIACEVACLLSKCFQLNQLHLGVCMSVSTLHCSTVSRSAVQWCSHDVLPLQTYVVTNKEQSYKGWGTHPT